MSLDGPGLLALGAWLTAGMLIGVLYFLGLWWNVRWFAERGRAGTAILLLLGRVALLAGLLTLAARQGAPPLLLMALGIFIARLAVTRHLRAAAS